MTVRVPHKSGAHRIAAIALFRTLITQSKALPHPQPQLLHLIRNRFKESRHVTSIRRLRVSFEAGYEAIDLLDNAVAGDAESQQRINSLLERAPARAKEPKVKKGRSCKDGNKANMTPEADIGDGRMKRSIFDRPLPLDQLSGKRHVPVLFNANKVPVLRFTKPQPAHLSGYIRGRVEQRQKWHDRRLELENDLYLAGRETEWDDLIDDMSHGRGGAEREDHGSTWEDVVGEALSEVLRKIAAEKELNRTMAEKMQAVVDREKALFEQERAERREAKRRQREQMEMHPVVDPEMPQADMQHQK